MFSYYYLTINMDIISSHTDCIEYYWLFSVMTTARGGGSFLTSWNIYVIIISTCTAIKDFQQEAIDAAVYKVTNSS